METKIKTIQKRNGNIEKFSKKKISNSIYKIFLELGLGNRKMADIYASEVMQNLLASNVDDDYIFTTDDISNELEKVLAKYGHIKAIKAYWSYRERKQKRELFESAFIDISKMLNDYLHQDDWRVKENSNAGFSYPGLAAYAVGSVIAHYVLTNMYPDAVADAHKSGAIHIHDLAHGIIGYCAGWSLQQLLLEGFNGVPIHIESRPPRHLRTAIAQMVNFIGVLQTEWAGAQAFNNVDTLLAPFVYFDRLDYKEVKQNIQELVYGLNITSRWSQQTPFSNVTLDVTCPEHMKNEPVIYDGRVLEDHVYGEFQKEMDMINKAFCEVMMEGDKNGKIFTFPIITYNIDKNFNWDSEIIDKIFKMTAKYGTPYFQNFVNSNLDPSDVRSMCCRLQLSMRELRNKTGGIFGAGDQTGSLGVVTINLPRIGYEAKTEKQFFKKLDRMLDLAKLSLEIKRIVVERNLENNLMPYTKRYLGTYDHHFSTIGIIGAHEAVLNFMGKGIQEKEAKEFVLKIMDHILERLKEFQEETGNLYNLEATPAEGASYRLAKLDKKLYPDIITSGTDSVPYYTNSTMLPVDFSEDIFAVLDHQEELQIKYTSGTVLHIYLGEMIEDSETVKKLVRKIFNKYRIPYISITPTFSICQQHGYISGEKTVCPICGLPTLTYSRVVGYYRPVQLWNKGKQQEFKDRLEYKIGGQ